MSFITVRFCMGLYGEPHDLSRDEFEHLIAPAARVFINGHDLAPIGHTTGHYFGCRRRGCRGRRIRIRLDPKHGFHNTIIMPCSSWLQWGDYSQCWFYRLWPEGAKPGCLARR